MSDDCKKIPCIPPWCVAYPSTTLEKITNMSFRTVLTLLSHIMCQKLLLHVSFTRNKFHDYYFLSFRDEQPCSTWELGLFLFSQQEKKMFLCT